jgi:transglutaminase-like putative cysteine protease
MFYAIRHVTQFRYSAPISESLSELRMQPRSEGLQRCRSFLLGTDPQARMFVYRDHLGNVVHHFDIPGAHRHLTITAEAVVELATPPPLPDTLAPTAWEELDALIGRDDYWEYLLDSRFAWSSDLLLAFARELRLTRRDDPLSLLREMNGAINAAFEYVPQHTHVDSPIDDALKARRGVCQDFSHIMIALCRRLRIPARYVSGYLFHRSEEHDRSEPDATHAWVEALLPELGWVGFDPTNNLIAGERHVRTAVGRDYADVPPVRGVFKGTATSELAVAVSVSPSEAPPPEEELPPLIWMPLGSPDQQQEQEEQQQQ